MKKIGLALVVSICALALVTAKVMAAPLDDAKALIEKAEAYYVANGKDATVKEVGNPKGQFVIGELYVFAWDLNGTVQAQPMNPKQVGMNLQEVPDVDGKYFRREIVDIIKKNGAGTIEYKYKHPITGKIEPKVTYCKKVGDLILGCGVYK